jgi:pimeloyl-ACP methyl ester carboxylesterase
MKKFIILVLLYLAGTIAQAQNKAIEVITTGEGIPVLFLPGFSCPGSVWDETVAQLPGGFQAHQVTYAGFGGVAPIAMPWYASLKNDLIAYIKDQKFENLCIIGHSMGGNLATTLAAELPEQVTKLLLVDAIPCMREIMMPGVTAEQITYESPYSNQLLEMDEAALKQYAQMMASNMTNNKSDVEKIVNYIVSADRKTYVYGYIDLLKLDLRNELPHIKADVFILGATFPNKEAVQANYEKQYAKLAKKEMVFANNSKHFIMFDEPDWFYEQTNTFLKK